MIDYAKENNTEMGKEKSEVVQHWETKSWDDVLFSKMRTEQELKP